MLFRSRGHTTQVINWEQKARDYYAYKKYKSSWDYDVESIGELPWQEVEELSKQAYLDAAKKDD